MIDEQAQRDFDTIQSMRGRAFDAPATIDNCTISSAPDRVVERLGQSFLDSHHSRRRDAKRTDDQAAGTGSGGKLHDR